jgi:hypothetical protein
MNDNMWTSFFLLLSLLLPSEVLVKASNSSPQKESYTAAVVEYVPILSYVRVGVKQAQQIMNENLDNYEQYIMEAAAAGAEIIVFPEDGLYGAYFLTREWALPYLEPLPPSSHLPYDLCGSSVAAEASPIAHRAACLARTYSIYLVIVMGEVVLCDPMNMTSSPYGMGEGGVETSHCPPDGRYQYNTQVRQRFPFYSSAISPIELPLGVGRLLAGRAAVGEVSQDESLLRATMGRRIRPPSHLHDVLWGQIRDADLLRHHERLSAVVADGGWERD